MAETESHDQAKQEASVIGNLPKLRIYVLRLSSPEGKFKIKALFDHKIRLSFNYWEGFDEKQDSSTPYIHILDLDKNIDQYNRLVFTDKTGDWPINGYQLCLSKKIMGSSKTLMDYIDDRERYLMNPQLEDHYFLFDVAFSRNYGLSPSGLDVPFWSQLCLFTFYLLRYELYDLFDLLIKEFQSVVDRDRRHFNVEDFKEFFQYYGVYAEYVFRRTRDAYRAQMILIRMVGCLPITRVNFDMGCQDMIRVTEALLEDLTTTYDYIFGTVSRPGWPLFRNGLSFYLAVQCINGRKDTLALVHRVKNDEFKRDLANAVLMYLTTLKRPVIALKWIDFLNLVEPNLLTLQQLELADSIQTYVESLVLVINQNLDQMNLTDEVTRQFDGMINQDRLNVNLDSIVFLLNFLAEPPNNEDPRATKILQMIHKVIIESLVLRGKIKNYLYKLQLTDEHVEKVRSILSQLSTSSLLYSVKKTELLNHLYTNTKINLTIGFVKRWFYTFLVFDEEPNDANQKIFREVLQHWSQSYTKNIKALTSIVAEIDRFLEALKTREYQSIFIQHMIEICFAQRFWSSILSEGLIGISNPLFLEQYKQRFSTTCLILTPEKFKQLANFDNPLFHLIKLYNQNQEQSILVNDLIELITSKMSFTQQEVFKDAFEQPSRTSCVYRILFNECFRKVTVRGKIIDHLLAIRKPWDEKGFRANEIRIWNNKSKEEKQVIREIFNYIGEIAQKSSEIDDLIKGQQQELEEKIRIKDRITKCLESSCPHASNRDHYLRPLRDMEEQLRSEIVRDIQIAEEIQSLGPFADCLNPLEKLHSWKKFLRQQLKRNSIGPSGGVTTTSEPNSPDVVDQDPFLDDQRTTGHFALDLAEVEEAEVKDERDCLTILQDHVAILDLFINRWKTLCQEWKHLPISDVLILFPDVKYVDHDFEILKDLHQSDSLLDIKSILDYWKNRERINHVCQGWTAILDDLKLNVDAGRLEKLKQIPQINSRTLGLKCALFYQNYVKNFMDKFSIDLLNFLAEYSSAHDLIIFVNRLGQTDVDNLRLAVNDWDETLVNTRTVFDFVQLKQFFDQFDAAMKAIQKNDVPVDPFDQISAAFDKTFNDKEFKNLFTWFRTCSASLTSIEQIHLELTDKGLYKRTRISDLMREMNFFFTEKANQFDMGINGATMTFTDLSELRDRARLMEYSINNNCNTYQSNSERQRTELASFVTFVEIVEKVLKNFTSLNLAGHPGILKYLHPNKLFKCVNSDYQELVDLSLTLDDLLYDWEIHLCQMYEKHLDLTYFAYQQIWTVEEFLYNRKDSLQRIDPGYHLLKFIGIDPDAISMEYLPHRSDNPNERLAAIGQILTAQRKQTPLRHKEENSSVKEVSLVECSDQGILRAILSLFRLSGTPIAVNHLFYCTEETTWTEICAFTYRCFFSQQFHLLIRPELLSASIQDKFTHCLRELIKQSPQHYFRLGIITTAVSTNLQLVNGLRTLQIVQTVHDPELLNTENLQQMIREILGENSLLVKSKLNGLGKSFYIRQEIKRLKLNYIKFPISGDIHVDQIGERLRLLGEDLLPTKAALHVDIGVISQVKQLNELLYCLLLFRSFRLGQVAIHVPAEVKIYIELDSSPSSVQQYEKILVLKSINVQQFETINWKDFQMINAKATRFVLNYLQAIENQSILTREIREDKLDDIPADKAIDLLKRTFLKDKKRPEFVTWTQLDIFISVYYRLFSGFSRCGFFLLGSLPNPRLRLDLLQTLLDCAQQFTSLCVDDVRQGQRSVYSNDVNAALSEAIVRWDTTQPFTLVFSAEDSPIFVYKRPTDVPQTLVDAFRFYYEAITKKKDHPLEQVFPDYNKFTHERFFLKLASLSTKYFNKAVCIRCYRQYSYDELFCLHCGSGELLSRSASMKHEDIEHFQKAIAQRIQIEYVLTPDNYIKMLLIYLRVQSGLPVLIMGETGCGKTALIQFLCQKLLDDELAVFRIHAGITNEIILDHMRIFCQQALICLEAQKRLWIFFDEFNTTSSIGLIKEIMCERTCLGQPVPDNIVLLGACNPQRRQQERQVSDNNVGIKKDLYELERLRTNAGVALLYTVVPIPETMLEYVWDYGFLDSSTEEAYIRTMLNTCEKLDQDSVWFNLTVTLISRSQRFFRESEDVSSVSLRDVARFCRLYNWFCTSIVAREGEERFQRKPGLLLRRATLTSLLLCYYFRLSSISQRQSYCQQIETILGPLIPDVSNMSNYLSKSLFDEQKQFLQRMKLPAGIAQNRALMDNVFVSLVCIVNRIPVIICGKPGCSKTSAIQIVISNLNGKKSSDPYFRTLPELMAVSYQGSQNCTSESIIKVFQRADKYLNMKNEANILPVIVFDEIGLAELSTHNPLKVLHSKLEVETCQYGFVGLSNWRLDASKMNRTLYLSCPDPTVEDLKLTAETIADAVLPIDHQLIRIDRTIIHALAVSYHHLYEHLQSQREQQRYANYFGLRDFYSLIKGVIHDFTQVNGQIDLYECIRRHLIINFDGIVNGYQFLWNDFCQSIHQEYLIEQYKSPSFKQLLDERLKSRQGRYLMLIAENESVIDYVERYMVVHHQPPPVRTLIGSCFSGDLISGTTYTEKYNYRVLMDIILYAETNVTLVMRRMGHLYDNLYDLFNQNFAVSGKRKYCRIALGALYHPRCLVNDDFYCVVFVRKDDLARCDPPFLNRFEKHLVDMDSLVDQRHSLITKNFLDDLIQLVPKDIHESFPLLQHLFVDYSPDYICNLVIDAFNHLRLSLDDENSTPIVIDDCRKKLLRTASFDLPLILARQSDSIHPWIDEYYSIHENLSFQNVLEKALAEEELPHQIIYTYTQLYHTLTYSSNAVDQVNLSSFKNELELTTKIKQHYQKKDQQRLLIIRLDFYQEHEHILLLKHILLNSKVSQSNRGVWLICHLQRNLLNQISNDVLFNGWTTLMINDLNEHKLLPKEILLNPSYRALVTHMDIQFSSSMLDELLDRCLTKFRYTVSLKERTGEINQRRNRIVDCLIRQTSSLRSVIEKELSQLVETVEFARFKDWRWDLLSNGVIIGTCRSFNDALHSVISIFFETYLLLLISHLEKYSLIDSYLFYQTNPKHRHALEQLWTESFSSTLKLIDKSMVNIDMIEVPLIFDLQLPCARMEYEVIRSIRRVIQQRRDNDDRDDDTDLVNSALKQLHSKSVYGTNNIEKIFKDVDLFHSYYNDQLLFAQDEGKFHGLSTGFVQRLLTSNPNRTHLDHMKHLLVDAKEFFAICRLLDIAFRLIPEQKFLDEILDHQLCQLNEEQQTTYYNDSAFYRLVFTDEKIFLVPPRTNFSPDEQPFTCAGDCFIEVALMNLVEYLTCQTIIGRIENIEQVTTIYSLVAQGMFDLSTYWVNNLEKLRSFISLLRCITTLVSSAKAVEVFKNACAYAGFNGTFETCARIHEFIEHFRNIIKASEARLDNSLIDQNLWKLESEFLKNWLPGHKNDYFDVLTLISQRDNRLWQYSAKIFTFIEVILDLKKTSIEYHGQIPLTEEVASLNNFLIQLNDPSRKIEHLMVTRLHMQLIYSWEVGELIANRLAEHFTFFEENIRELQNSPQKAGLLWACRLAWVKAYAQCYGSILFDDSKHSIVEKLDQFLTRDEFRFCSTIKLFLIKQICQASEMTLDRLKEVMTNRNVTWIQSITATPTGQRTQEARREFVLPTPLFVGRDEFNAVDQILTHNASVDQIRTLIDKCRKRQDTFYGFLVWFIHYYARFALNQDSRARANYYCQVITNDLSQDITECFQPIGYKFLVFLCTNFNGTTYFCLNPQMAQNEIHQRLVALDMFALLLSFRVSPHPTYLSSLLFNEQMEMPLNYSQHYRTSVCLPGLLINDPVVTQMLEVRHTVQERLNVGQIHQSGKFIFQCSEDCLWMFYFVNCGVPVDASTCPLCQKPIGAARYGVLIQRDPPQIQRTIEEAFRFIDQYLEQYQRKPRFGYHHEHATEHSNEMEKPNHLNRSISFRFMHFLTHTTLFVLDELSLLTDFNKTTQTYFHDHFEKDYSLLGQQLANGDQSYLWIYKIINHMLTNDLHFRGPLNSNDRVIELEKFIEEKILFQHIESVVNEINQYKTAYSDFLHEQNKEITVNDYVDEIYENEEKYPALSYFNVTNINTTDPIVEFRHRLENIPFVEKKYPVTAFLMKHLEEYANIQYLYPIIVFTNYLIEKFNHRIERNVAAEKTISYFLTQGFDCETMSQLYTNFRDAWFELKLKEVRYGCQTPRFQRNGSKEDFAANTKMALVLLNTSKDDSSILLAACLRTIGEFQNDIVRFFHRTISDHRDLQNGIPVQSIRPEDILLLDSGVISNKLIKDGLTINYKYGRSKDIIYDYEEIEIFLRNLISSLPLIDTENLRCLNYQFELYSENTSLINDVRQRIPQDLMKEEERNKLKPLLKTMPNDGLLHYLGSLDYVFTYLRNIDPETPVQSMTVQAFVEKSIRSSACLSDHVLQSPHFATIELRYIIHLYELIEEFAFDNVLRHYVKKGLTEEELRDAQPTELVRQFRQMTFKKERIALSLSTIEPWIGILKRLMIRVLSNVNVSLGVPMQLYLERTDLWPGTITINDLQTFDVDEHILLKHTFIILKGLEEELNQIRNGSRRQLTTTDSQISSNTPNSIQNSETQLSQARAWRPQNASPTTRILKNEKKVRV